MNVARITIALGLAVALTVGIASAKSSTVSADDTFSIEVVHGINGKSLGLSKDLPVTATVELNGDVIATLDLTFREIFEGELPAGTYVITVESLEAGPLPSMTVGPVDIPAGADIRLQARLSANKTPILAVK